MEQTITITPKWQIYIPDKIRAAIQLTTPGKATMNVKGNTIVITMGKSSILTRAGKYQHKRAKKGFSVEKLRDSIDYSNI